MNGCLQREYWRQQRTSYRDTSLVSIKEKSFFIFKAIQGWHKLGGQWVTFTQSLHIPSSPETYILRDLFLTGQKWTEDRIAFPSLVWGTRQEDWEQTSTSLFDQNLILSILDLDPEAAIHFLRRNCLPPSPCVHSLAWVLSKPCLLSARLMISPGLKMLVIEVTTKIMGLLIKSQP